MASPRTMIDSRMRLMALSCGAFILSASCIAVVLNGHGWSWPPFVWGILIGPLWIGWAQVSGEFMAKAAMKPTKIPAEDVAQFGSARWRRWWAGYVSTCLVGVARWYRICRTTQSVARFPAHNPLPFDGGLDPAHALSNGEAECHGSSAKKDRIGHRPSAHQACPDCRTSRSRASRRPERHASERGKGESCGATREGESARKAATEGRPVGAHGGIKPDRPECVPTGRPPNDPNRHPGTTTDPATQRPAPGKTPRQRHPAKRPARSLLARAMQSRRPPGLRATRPRAGTPRRHDGRRARRTTAWTAVGTARPRR